MTARRGADDRTDEELASAWQDGDAAAFDAIVGRFTRRVYGICYRYFDDPTDAEEATQETFVALHRRGHSFRGQSKFSTWLYRVTTNVCHDIARKRARRPETVSLDAAGRSPDGGGRTTHELPTDDPDAQDALIAAELGHELAAAFALLDTDQRTAVYLHDVVGLPYDAIATRQGIAVGTAKSRVHRGHARLADALSHLRSQPAGAREPDQSAPRLTPRRHD